MNNMQLKSETEDLAQLHTLAASQMHLRRFQGCHCCLATGFGACSSNQGEGAECPWGAAGLEWGEQVRAQGWLACSHRARRAI